MRQRLRSYEKGESMLRNEKGIVLVVALLLLLALTLIGIASISTTNFEGLISGNERVANAAFFASEAGIQVALSRLPESAPISKSLIGSDTYYSGSVRPVWSGPQHWQR